MATILYFFFFTGSNTPRVVGVVNGSAEAAHVSTGIEETSYVVRSSVSAGD